MEPWWKDGLRFSCTQCGKCCHAREDVSHVYVNRREREALALHLGISAEDFDARYTRRDAEGHVELRFEEGRCVFLEDNTCQVHEAKPVQCRTFPFWEELVASERAWQEQVENFCPGAGQGSLVPARRIAAQVAETEAAFERGES